VVVNTSFNVRGEPIVCTPEDAFRCFMGTELDVLAVGNCVMYKEQQDPELKRSYAERLEKD
jgi:carbamoyltransferase